MGIVSFMFKLLNKKLLINGLFHPFRTRQTGDGPAIYQIADPVDHAEGPTWDARKNILYYVDIHSGHVLAYHFNTNKITKINLNGDVSPVIPSRKNPNLLLVGLNRSVVAVEWDGQKKLGEQQVLATVSNSYPASRFNDGKADKNGRLWWGKCKLELETWVENYFLYYFYYFSLLFRYVLLHHLTIFW